MSENKLHPKFKPARLCRKCGAAGKPFKKHSGNKKNGICLDCHADYVKDYTKRKWVELIQENNFLREELSQARKLIAELVKMGEFYGNPDNYQRGKKLPHGFCIIFNSIDDDYERVRSHPVSDPFYSSENLSSYGGKHAREVLSNNKDLIEKLTKG